MTFTSNASELVAGDTTGTWNVFVRDRKTHVTRRVSTGPGGVQPNEFSQLPTISAHGRHHDEYVGPCFSASGPGGGCARETPAMVLPSRRNSGKPYAGRGVSRK